MTSAEGGMITTDDDFIAEKSRVIRQHGMHRRYYHDELGFNFRMTDVHAAIGLEQLKKLEGRNEQRCDNARFLNSNLKGVIIPTTPKGYEHVYHQYTVRVPGGKRDALRTYLQEHGVGSEVYYPVPVHKQSFYEGELSYRGSFPEAELAASEVLSLPVHPALSQADLDTIVSRVNEFMTL
jgi:dTDP-4-amino-4,6-dideoxygalactose transaminase